MLNSVLRFWQERGRRPKAICKQSDGPGGRPDPAARSPRPVRGAFTLASLDVRNYA